MSRIKFNRIQSATSCERGVAMTELVMVFPLLIVLIVAAVELGHMLHLKQGAAFVAREAARYAFRECSPYQNQVAADACVDHIQNRMQNLGRNFLDDQEMDLIVAIWDEGDMDPRSIHPPGVHVPGTLDTSDNGFKSLIGIKLRQVGSHAGLDAMMTQNNRVVTAEVELVYNPFYTREIPGIVNVTEIGFYELAIF